MFRWFKFLFCAGAVIAANAVFSGVLFLAVVYQHLPNLDVISDYRPRLPMRVFSADGELIGEFGEERRAFAHYDDFPHELINALLATEDVRFYEHHGVDLIGVARAVVGYAVGRREGASTITMQLARNFYLKRDRTILRKVVEIMLALKIEQQFSKEAILERYVNQIYLGHGSYGFRAAAREYYGKTLGELSLAETAVLVGLPKSPSKLNPRRNPSAAKMRQQHVLNRMRAIGILQEAEYWELYNADLPPLAQTARRVHSSADYVAERARQIIYDTFGDAAYERGLNIYTTIQSSLQRAAQTAVRNGLLAHDARQGYPGPEQYIDTRGFERADYAKALRGITTIGGLQPALVVDATALRLVVISKNGKRYILRGKQLERVRRHLPGSDDAQKPVINKGAVVRLQFAASEGGEGGGGEPLQVVSVPTAQAALVAVASDDGAILALVGGFDFRQNQFNNVDQARRQPGSAIKAFIYSAALEKGIMPAATLPDTPIFLTREETGSDRAWAPQNYDGETEGDITMRHAFAKSKNLATVHLLKRIGAPYAHEFLLRFGFRREDHFPYLTLGLGAGVATPLEMARGYAAFANGGYLVNPYLIARIEDDDGNVVAKELDYAQRRVVIDKRNAYIIRTLLQSVITDGTGRGVKKKGLVRADIGGKTGTTNDTQDAWFTGYGGDLTAVAWVGYPQIKSLGANETGAQAALPIWRDFMTAALANQPQLDWTLPEGVIVADVDAASGKLLLDAAAGAARQEYFYSEYLPIALDSSHDSSLPDADTEELL